YIRSLHVALPIWVYVGFRHTLLQQVGSHSECLQPMGLELLPVFPVLQVPTGLAGSQSFVTHNGKPHRHCFGLLIGSFICIPTLHRRNCRGIRLLVALPLSSEEHRSELQSREIL